MLRIAVSGYYGFKNTGDDAILMALIATLKALAPGVEITVLSNAPAETRRYYGVGAVNRWNPFSVCWTLLRSDLLLSGGGGLLQDVTAGGVRSICYYLAVVLLALVQGKQVVYYAQGVGPVRTRFGRWLVRVVSNRVDLITVRDQASRDDLVAMGVTRPPIVVTADPVLALGASQLNPVPGRELLKLLRRGRPGPSPEAGQRAAAPGRATGELQAATEQQAQVDAPGQAAAGLQAAAEQQANTSGRADASEQANTSGRADASEQASISGAPGRLGIVVREWSGSDCYKKVVAAVADRFTRDGWEIVLIPFHFPEDVQACREVSLLMQETSLMVRTWQAVETLFGLLGELDLVLAMRLHAIIMASVMRVPCVGISYDPKVERFLELVGQPNAGGVDGLEEEALYRVLLEAWERRQETVANLDRVLAHLRQQAWETASLTLSVFYARSPRKRRELQRSGRGGGEALGSRLVSARGRGRGASRP